MRPRAVVLPVAPVAVATVAMAVVAALLLRTLEPISDALALAAAVAAGASVYALVLWRTAPELVETALRLVGRKARAVRSVATTADALVLTLSDDRFAHATLGVIRTLGRLGVRTHLLAPDHHGPADRSRYLTTSTPLRDTTEDAVVEAVRKRTEEAAEPPVLVVVGDPAALCVDAIAEELARYVRLPRPPPGLPRHFADKDELRRLAAAHGVPTPRTARPTSLDEAERFAAEVGFPIMVKAADPRLIDWAGGQISVRGAADVGGLRGLLLDAEERLRPNLLLQEFIPGGTAAVWFFHGYFDATSTCLFGAVGQKLREHPPGAGSTTLAVVRPHAAIEAAATAFVGDCGFQGIVDAEFRIDPRSGQAVLLDLNPRVGPTSGSSSTSTVSTWCGPCTST